MSGPGTNGTSSRAWASPPTSCRRFSTACRSREGARRHQRRAPRGARAQLPVTIQPVMSTQAGFGALAQRARPRADRDRRAHRHDLARRHGLDQSRAVGQPPRPVRAREARRHVQERAHSLDLQLGLLAQGPAHRARHRRDEPVHPAVRARALACDQRRAPDPDRHALRSVHPARPRCAQLRLLPGGALHPGGDAVRHHARARRRRAPVDRDAADRHWRRTGSRRSSRPSSTSSRRSSRSRSTTSSATAKASLPSATGCATRPAARSICGSRRARSSRSSAR